LFEDLIELALEPLGYFLLDAGGPLFQLLDFRAQIAERVLPGVMGGIPARFQIGAARPDAFEIGLQCFDLAHVFERRIFQLLDLLSRVVNLFPGGGVLLLVLHLHQLTLILLEDLLMIGELAVHPAALFGELIDGLLEAGHFIVGSLPLAIDGCERFGLAGQLFFTVAELRQDGLQFP